MFLHILNDTLLKYSLKEIYNHNNELGSWLNIKNK